MGSGSEASGARVRKQEMETEKVGKLEKEKKERGGKGGRALEGKNGVLELRDGIYVLKESF